MDFEKRLERAIDRGKQTRNAKGRQQTEQSVSEDELKTMHSKCRLDLSEHVENCLKQVADHFPGFRFQTVVDEGGWGAKVIRDDLAVVTSGQAESLYSRLEMLVRPFSSTHIVELVAKGTIRNKEIFNRTHFQFLNQLDVDSFSELVDLWVLEFVEQYAART